MSKNINDMTKKEIMEVPHRKRFDEPIGKFNGLIIIPRRSKHDSGYACMSFVAEKNGEALVQLSGGSDVIDLNGIGGRGKEILKNNFPRIDWSIDCLYKSKLLRLFTHSYHLECGPDISNFEIFAVAK